MPLMILKMAIMRFLPLLIGAGVFYVAAIVGLVFAFDGWGVFFSIVGLTLLAIAVTGFLIYRSVKAQVNEQMEMMQKMMAGVGGVDLSAMMGMMNNTKDMIPQKKLSGNSVNVSDVSTKGDIAITTAGVAGAVAIASEDSKANEIVADVEGGNQDFTLGDFDFGDLEKMMGDLDPEQMKLMEEAAAQMMKMFDPSILSEGGSMRNFFEDMPPSKMEDVDSSTDTVEEKKS